MYTPTRAHAERTHRSHNLRTSGMGDEDGVALNTHTFVHTHSQILYNLASNAVKFTERGSVDVRARYSDAVLEIAVRDTGVGIPPEHLKRLFQPFSQVGFPPFLPHLCKLSHLSPYDLYSPLAFFFPNLLARPPPFLHCTPDLLQHTLC